MRKWKKICSCIAVCMMVLGMQGCGSSKKEDTEPGVRSVIETASKKLNNAKSFVYTYQSKGKQFSVITSESVTTPKLDDAHTISQYTILKEENKKYEFQESDSSKSKDMNLYIFQNGKGEELTTIVNNHNTGYFYGYSQNVEDYNIEDISFLLDYIEGGNNAPYFKVTTKKEEGQTIFMLTCKDIKGYQNKLIEKNKKEYPDYDPLDYAGIFKVSKNEYKEFDIQVSVDKNGYITKITQHEVIDYGDDFITDMTYDQTYTDFDNVKLNTVKADELMKKGANKEFAQGDIIDFGVLF